MTNRVDENGAAPEPFQSEADKHRGISRREMIRGAGTALPLIATFRSGSVLANTSNNYITRSSTSGEALCLDTDTTGVALNNPNLIDLGSDPRANVISMPSSLEYRTQGVNGERLLTPGEACGLINDPEFQVKIGSEWKSLSIKPSKAGAVVSAAAVASFGSKLTSKSITELI